jgi:hypothetical protein
MTVLVVITKIRGIASTRGNKSESEVWRGQGGRGGSSDDDGFVGSGREDERAKREIESVYFQKYMDFTNNYVKSANLASNHIDHPNLNNPNLMSQYGGNKYGNGK